MSAAYHAILVSLVAWAYVVLALSVVVISADWLARRRHRRRRAGEGDRRQGVGQPGDAAPVGTRCRAGRVVRCAAVAGALLVLAGVTAAAVLGRALVRTFGAES